MVPSMCLRLSRVSSHAMFLKAYFFGDDAAFYGISSISCFILLLQLKKYAEQHFASGVKFVCSMCGILGIMS